MRLPHIWDAVLPAAVAAVVLAATVSCRTDTGSGEFAAPRIVKTAVNVNLKVVKLRGELSDTRIERCGFACGPAGGDLQRTDCELEGYSFELRLTGLSPGVKYQWYAFAAAGENEIRSSTEEFTMGETTPDSIIDIPDPEFRQFLLEEFDRDYDGRISVREAEDITEICIASDGIYSLEGIEYMTRLESLWCRNGSDEGRGGLTELDLSNNPGIRALDVSYNRLTKLDIRDLSSLEELHCNDNELDNLDLGGNPALTILCTSVNHLTSIDLSGNKELTDLHIDRNLLEEIDISQNIMLRPKDTDLGPMPDENGDNMLKKVYLSESQRYRGFKIPDGTKVIYK